MPTPTPLANAMPAQMDALCADVAATAGVFADALKANVVALRRGPSIVGTPQEKRAAAVAPVRDCIDRASRVQAEALISLAAKHDIAVSTEDAAALARMADQGAEERATKLIEVILAQQDAYDIALSEATLE